MALQCNLTASWEAVIRIKSILGQSVLLACVVVTGTRAAELKSEAARGFERYAHLTEMRMSAESQPGGAFLWVDSLPEARRIDVYRRLQSGEVVADRLETPDPTGRTQTPGAMIHHWVGAVLVPGASLKQVLMLLQDYDHHAQFYSPDVVKSKTLDHTGNDFKVYLRLKRKEIVTVVLDTEYDVHYQQLDATRAISRSYSTHIAEVGHSDQSGEHVTNAGEDHGYLWRLNSYWKLLETERGTYVQCEAISLTRDIPTGLHWMIGPFVESIPRESLQFTLRSTRSGVLKENVHAAQ
jgi:hypothetical protein